MDLRISNLSINQFLDIYYWKFWPSKAFIDIPALCVLEAKALVGLLYLSLPGLNTQ